MTTEVEVCRNALLHLGENEIQSLSDGTEAANTCVNMYPGFRLSMFASHPWNFARTRVQLARRVTAPVNQWTYAYAIPNDVARPEEVFNTASAGARGMHHGWERVGSSIETDEEVIVLKYIASVDEGFWPGAFTVAVEYALAAHLCMAVTGNRTLQAQVREIAWGTPGELMRGGLMGIARQADAASNLSPVIDDYSLINARWGGDGAAR